jgi:hypothetical protein
MAWPSESDSLPAPRGRLLGLMSSGLGLFAIAVAAMLKSAVKSTLTGVDLGTVGVIVMVIGAAGLAISLWLTVTDWNSRDTST